MSRIIVLRVLESYFRHRWLYLLPLVIMSSIAVFYFLTQERSYISSGIIFTEQNSLLSTLTSVEGDSYSWNTPAQDTTNQITDLIKTNSFIRAVIQETDLEAEMSKGDLVAKETIEETRKRIWASVAGTNQVQVNAASPDPWIAHQLAQATISTFVQWRINLDRIDSVTAGDFFRDLIQVYKSDVVKAQQSLRSYLETHPEPVRGSRLDTDELEIQNLQAELKFAETRLAEALGKAEEARLAEAQVESNIRQKYTVVDAPDLPEKPATSRRQLAMKAAIFLVVGVLLSGFTIVGATILERSFRIPTDVQLELNLPVLAIVPDISAKNKRSRTPRRNQTATTKSSESIPEMLEVGPVQVNHQEEIPGPTVDEPVEALTTVTQQADVPLPVRKRRSRGKKMNVLIAAESRGSRVEWLEEPLIAVDLPIELTLKDEQKLES